LLVFAGSLASSRRTRELNREDNPMPTYMIERFLPGVTASEVRATAARAKHEAVRMTEEGTAVQYLESMFSVEDETGFCLFEGPSREAIREANARAQIPFERIAEVIHISAEEVD